MGSLQTLGAAAAGAAALVSTRRRRPRLGSGRAGGAPRRGDLDSGRGGDCSSPTWRPRDGARQDGVAHQPGTRGARSLRAPRRAAPRPPARVRRPLEDAARQSPTGAGPRSSLRSGGGGSGQGNGPQFTTGWCRWGAAAPRLRRPRGFLTSGPWCALDGIVKKGCSTVF